MPLPTTSGLITYLIRHNYMKGQSSRSLQGTSTICELLLSVMPTFYSAPLSYRFGKCKLSPVRWVRSLLQKPPCCCTYTLWILNSNTLIMHRIYKKKLPSSNESRMIALIQLQGFLGDYFLCLSSFFWSDLVGGSCSLPQSLPWNPLSPNLYNGGGE